MLNNVKAKIQKNEKVLGTFFSMGNISAMELLGYTGLDFVIIDTEHGQFDTETTMDLVRAAESSNLAPFIRIGDVTHKEIQRAVDMGAQGLIVPCLRTLDEVRKLVDLSKFSPIGNRGFFMGRGSGFGYQDWARDGIENFMERSNDKVLILPQCETVEALESIEEIVNIDGIDGIFIGPFDLSIAMGLPGQFKNEKFVAAIDRILKACKDAGKPAFIYTGSIEDTKKYFADGFEGVAHTIDAAVLAEGYKKIVKTIWE